MNRERWEEEQRAASQPEPEPEPEPEQEEYGDVSYQPEPVHRQVNPDDVRLLTVILHVSFCLT